MTACVPEIAISTTTGPPTLAQTRWSPSAGASPVPSARCEGPPGGCVTSSPAAERRRDGNRGRIAGRRLFVVEGEEDDGNRDEIDDVAHTEHHQPGGELIIEGGQGCDARRRRVKRIQHGWREDEGEPQNRGRHPGEA